MRLSCSLVAISVALGAPVFAQEAEELPAIPVTASSYETEGSGSYATELVSVGEKDAVPLRRIPQSTSVITRRRIEDGGFTSLDTALRKTPGMVVLNNDNGRSSLFSRGFELDYLYFNGLPAPLSSIYGTQPDMAIIDHVEILRGPAGLFTGAGEPAGAVNMRLKKPMAERGGYLRAEGHSFGRGRVEADVTGALIENGRVRGRAVFAFDGGKGFVDDTDNQTIVGFGALAVDVTPDTEFTLSLSRMDRDITPDNGLPTLADGRLLDLPRDSRSGADWNNFENAVTDVIAELEHRLDNGGHVKLSSRYADRDADMLYAFAGSPANANGDISSLAYFGRTFEERSLALDVHASLPFEINSMTGNVILGADFQKVDSKIATGRGRINGPFNLRNWDVSAVAKPNPALTQRVENDITTYGAYGQLRFSPIERLTLIGGGRLTWYDSTTTSVGGRGPGVVKQDINARFTPYLGATVDLTDWATAYASYTAIFQPQSALDASGDAIKPRSGRQFEVGIKAELAENLNLSLAYFNMRDQNRAVTTRPGGPSIASGEVEISGFEIEASGEILPGWSLTAGYTYTDNQLVRGTERAQRWLHTPQHLAQLWTEYEFRSGALDGLALGGGFTAMTSFRSQGNDIKAPGYITFDLGARYQITENVEARLRVNNVFNNKYYARVGGKTVFNFYGEPRSAVLSLGLRF